MSGIPNSLISPMKWLEAIKFLQKNKRLDSRLNSELVLIWLISSIDGMLSDSLAIFKNNPKNQRDYIHMLVTCFERGLKS